MATLEFGFYIFKTFSFYQYSNAINLESHFQKLTLKKSRTWDLDPACQASEHLFQICLYKMLVSEPGDRTTFRNLKLLLVLFNASFVAFPPLGSCLLHDRFEANVKGHSS